MPIVKASLCGDNTSDGQSTNFKRLYSQTALSSYSLGVPVCARAAVRKKTTEPRSRRLDRQRQQPCCNPDPGRLSLERSGRSFIDSRNNLRPPAVQLKV